MEENIMLFETKECTNPDIVKELLLSIRISKGQKAVLFPLIRNRMIFLGIIQVER